MNAISPVGNMIERSRQQRSPSIHPDHFLFLLRGKQANHRAAAVTCSRLKALSVFPDCSETPLDARFLASIVFSSPPDGSGAVWEADVPSPLTARKSSSLRTVRFRRLETILVNVDSGFTGLTRFLSEKKTNPTRFNRWSFASK